MKMECMFDYTTRVQLDMSTQEEGSKVIEEEEEGRGTHQGMTWSEERRDGDV